MSGSRSKVGWVERSETQHQLGFAEKVHVFGVVRQKARGKRQEARGLHGWLIGKISRF